MVDNEKDRLEVIRSLILDAIRESRRGHSGDIVIAESAAEAILQRHLPMRDEAIPPSSSTTTASYLRLIQSMLAATRNGVSRSRFLGLIFDALRGRGEVGSRTIMLLEGYFDSEKKTLRELKIPHYIGAREASVKSLENDLRNRKEYAFTYDLVASKRLLDFELSSVLSTYGERTFSPYCDDYKSLRSGDLWISSIPLVASEEGEPERALVGLYNVVKGSSDIGIPPGARQEWDILQLMPEIYDLLQYRVSMMKNRVDNEQAIQIVDLAPGAITHELGTSLGIMESALGRVPKMLAELAEQVGAENEQLIEISNDLVAIQRQLDLSRETTESFTNLERRNPKTRTQLETVVNEISTVLSRRLSLANTEIVTDIPKGFEIETDVRYVTHVLMNVIINAIEAIRPSDEEEAPDGPRPKKTIAVQVRRNDDMVDITIANDGPEIPTDIVARVFQKGITTKPYGIGHGQGLHLCKQIATHLGGSFGFGSPPKTLKCARVSFLLSIPAEVQYEADQ